MDAKLKMGISAAQTGLQVVNIGKRALELKKRLPGEKKKAARKALQRAAKKAEKQSLRAEKKQRCRARDRKAVRNTKGIGRVALAIWNRYF